MKEAFNLSISKNDATVSLQFLNFVLLKDYYIHLFSFSILVRIEILHAHWRH